MFKRMKRAGAGWGLAAAGLVVLPIAGLAAGQEASGAEASAASLPAADLRPKWEAGQASRYEFWNQFEKQVQVEFAGESQQQTELTTVTGELSWAVASVAADGSSRCVMTMDWMRVESEIQGGQGQTASRVIDSREPAPADGEAMHDLISAMSGVAMDVQVAADGQITKVTGRDLMLSKSDHPDFIPSDRDFVESASDLATLPFAPPMPDGGLPLETRWAGHFTWDHELGEVDQNWSFTLADVQEIEGVPVAIVEGSGEASLTPEIPDRPAGAPEVSVQMLEGKVTTRVMFDLLRHEAIGRHTTGREQVRITASMPDGRSFVRTITEDSTAQVLRLSEE